MFGWCEISRDSVASPHFELKLWLSSLIALQEDYSLWLVGLRIVSHYGKFSYSDVRKHLNLTLNNSICPAEFVKNSRLIKVSVFTLQKALQIKLKLQYNDSVIKQKDKRN